ncbi:MAG: hypothetical protein ACFB6R_15845 [Alphaproteobacteria bacterium]
MSTGELIVTALGAYFGVGLVFALAFVTLGLARVDPNAVGAKTVVRVLLIPGAMALWPLMAVHWARGGIQADHPS